MPTTYVKSVGSVTPFAHISYFPPTYISRLVCIVLELFNEISQGIVLVHVCAIAVVFIDVIQRTVGGIVLHHAHIGRQRHNDR